MVKLLGVQTTLNFNDPLLVLTLSDCLVDAERDLAASVHALNKLEATLFVDSVLGKLVEEESILDKPLHLRG